MVKFMMEKCFFVLVVLSIVFAVMTGNLQNLSNAVIDGAAKAVTLVISLAGAMCLWSGVMEVLKDGGAVKKLARALSPVLKHVFPHAWQTGEGREEIKHPFGKYSRHRQCCHSLRLPPKKCRRQQE